MVAQAGSTSWLAEGVGVGLGVGTGVGEGEGDGDSEGKADGAAGWFVWTAPVDVVPQPATTTAEASASRPTLRLTELGNVACRAEVTGNPGATGA